MKKTGASVFGGLAVVALGISLQYLPEEFSTAIRMVNGFLIVALQVWIIRRVLSYERRLAAHESDMLQVVSEGEERRSNEVRKLAEETSRIAEELAADVKHKDEVAARTSDELTGKLNQNLAVSTESRDMLTTIVDKNAGS